MAGKASPTVAQYDSSWRFLSRILNKRNAEIESGFSAITVEDIEILDDPKRYNTLRCVIHSLRVIDENSPDVLSKEIKARLNYISRYGNSYKNPREPISAAAAEAAKLAADRAVLAARDRIRAGRIEKARVEELAIKSRDELRYLSIASGERSKNNDTNVQAYAESVVIGSQDAVAFIVALGLRVQIPFECLKTLRRDCLRNEARGFVDIVYLKGRGGIQPVWKRERVRDGGLSTPGGLVRLAIELTAPAAERLLAERHPDADNLWVGWVQSGRPAWRAFSVRTSMFRRALVRLGVEWDVHESGGGFAPSRMRKTVKAQMYRRSKGHLRRFATDHSVAVAARHYANVEALAEEHKDTVQRAQEDLLSVALLPLVLTPIEEQELLTRRDGAGVRTGTAMPEDAEVIGVAGDTWLGMCKDFWSSPFDRSPTGGCAAAHNACLRCANAVFTARRLPPLLAYRDWLIARREVMGREEWIGAYQDDLSIIDNFIIPKFSEIDLISCQEKSSSEFVFIPLHERRS